MSEFRVGDIAIYVREGSPNYGAEVAISGPLETRRLIRADLSEELCSTYVIDCVSWGTCPNPSGWLAKPEWLRRRPSKQDWKSLCNLTDLPREVTHV